MNQNKKKQILFEASIIISMISFGSMLNIGIMILIEPNNIVGGIGWIIMSTANLIVVYKLIKDRKDSNKEIFVINNDFYSERPE